MEEKYCFELCTGPSCSSEIWLFKRLRRWLRVILDPCKNTKYARWKNILLKTLRHYEHSTHMVQFPLMASVNLNSARATRFLSSFVSTCSCYYSHIMQFVSYTDLLNFPLWGLKNSYIVHYLSLVLQLLARKAFFFSFRQTSERLALQKDGTQVFTLSFPALLLT